MHAKIILLEHFDPTRQA